MLTIYRRHRKGCEHRSEGRRYRRCQCPISVEGALGDQYIRKALKLRDWQKAHELVREWEANGQRTSAAQSEAVTIEEAAEAFLADAQARKLNEATVYKYRLLFRQLENFARQRGLRFLTELDLHRLTAFRAEWKDGPRSSAKKLERLRAFLGFCQRRRWVVENQASHLKPPKVVPRPTMPFTRDEMLRILGALGKYSQRAGAVHAQRLRAFVLLLRYSGMRIGDAVSLTPDRILGKRLFLYTQKTGAPVHCVLPDFVVGALEAAPRSSESYYFWSGQSKLHNAISKWQQTLRTLFRLAGVQGGHAHRFRDTFAVEFLVSGGSVEELSVLLGHSSTRVTELHYAPWVQARQERLEAHLERAWAQDPIALGEMNHTRATHGNERLQ